MRRYLAQRLPRAVYKEYSDEHNTIWREELAVEFLQDLLRIDSILAR